MYLAFDQFQNQDRLGRRILKQIGCDEAVYMIGFSVKRSLTYNSYRKWLIK
jgi:hypothetical protein